MKTIRNATTNDIHKIVELYSKMNSSQLKLNETFFHQVFKKNSYVYRVLETEEGVTGIYSLYPLSKGIYEGMLKGTVKKNELPNFLLNYKSKDIYLYCDSLIVDTNNQNKNEYMEYLFLDMRNKLLALSKEKINVCEIGAITESKEEEKVIGQIGFEKKGISVRNSDESLIFRATVIDVILSKKLK
ncbi:hypothetical protein [Bacillus thuringiensis]|uniref:hypothetical protein n=1 Tax=Bacillus thuringiensis TaxID=1428 RepID=UPI0021D67069|nr:hypothetical protein [Bacillus thuringiensis]MCU7667604.1 hypothetical protein [Bacillus thuringiensis]